MRPHNSRIRFRLEVNQIRREELQGREHLVAPVIAVQEMILPNTNEFLPAEEIEASVLFWEGVPIALDHPTQNGDFASANQRGALEEQVVGRLFDVFFHAPSKQLRAEMWIDLELADRVDRGNEAVERIEAAERTRDLVEVSTSYFAKIEQKDGIHEGESFEGIQREIRPDHVAILLDDRGACGVTDGCGVPRSQQKANVRSSARRPTFSGTEETPWSRPSITNWIDGYVSNTGRTRPDTNRVADLPAAVRTWIASRTLLGEASADNERDLTFFPVVRPSTNKLNAGALRAVLGGRGAQARIPDAAKTSAQNRARSLLEANFGDRSQTGGSKVDKTLLQKALDLLGRAIGGETMDRKKTIEALVANAACPFKKAERLEEFSDEELTGLASTYLENKNGAGSGDDGGKSDGDKGKAGTEGKENASNTGGKSSAHAEGKREETSTAALSAEDVEGLKALREIGVDRLKELATSEKERRTALVEKLAANKSCSIDKKDLEKMHLAALEGLDRMLVPADYSGQGGPYQNATSRDSAIPKAPPVFLAAPVTNADDKSGGKKQEAAK